MALSRARYCKIISETFRPSSSSAIRRVWARQASTSCAGPEPPAPAPCPPRPPPPCRPPPLSEKRTAVRVACCPPARGRRPPCPPAPAPAPLTCTSQRQDAGGSDPGDACGKVGGGGGGGGCGEGQDRVARRLAAAEAARRADYEQEMRRAAMARASPAGAGAAPLSLGAGRHCARATDGQVYTLPCAPDPLPPCGAAREPPPPCRVPLQPDDACKVNSHRYVDPCAHRPRTFVEIARGKTEAPPASAPAPAPASARGLASRIMDGLTAGAARKCTPPTQEGGRGPCRRGLHTSAAGAAPDVSSKGIDGVLRERAAYREAGRGRVAGCEAGGGRAPPPAPSGAQLDLAVPPSATRVNVRVTLQEGPAPPPPPPPPAPRAAAEGAPASCAAPPDRRDSWLSFKSIQQKFSNKRDGDGCDESKTPAPCPAKPPCPPPGPRPAVPPPPPPKHPYPRHPCPPRPTCPPPKISQTSKDERCSSGSSSGSGFGCGVTAKYLPLSVV